MRNTTRKKKPYLVPQGAWLIPSRTPQVSSHYYTSPCQLSLQIVLKKWKWTSPRVGQWQIQTTCMVAPLMKTLILKVRACVCVCVYDGICILVVKLKQLNDSSECDTEDEIERCVYFLLGNASMSLLVTQYWMSYILSVCCHIACQYSEPSLLSWLNYNLFICPPFISIIM